MSRLPSGRRTSSTSAARSRAPNPGGRSSWRATTSRARRARTPATPSSRPARAFGAWSAATAYNRGQVLYRLAETMETRADGARRGLRGPARGRRARSTASSGTRAGRTSCRRCSARRTPSRGPYFNFTLPEPTGVVAVIAPDEPALDGLVGRVVPALVGGNAVVVVASEAHPLAAIELAEAVATSDVPAGVVNILTGSARRARARARGAHGRQRDRRHRRRRRRPRSSRRSPRRTSSASCGRARSAAPGRSARSSS